MGFSDRELVFLGILLIELFINVVALRKIWITEKDLEVRVIRALQSKHGQKVIDKILIKFTSKNVGMSAEGFEKKMMQMFYGRKGVDQKMKKNIDKAMLQDLLNNTGLGLIMGRSPQVAAYINKNPSMIWYVLENWFPKLLQQGATTMMTGQRGQGNVLSTRKSHIRENDPGNRFGPETPLPVEFTESQPQAEGMRVNPHAIEKVPQMPQEIPEAVDLQQALQGGP